MRRRPRGRSVAWSFLLLLSGVGCAVTAHPPAPLPVQKAPEEIVVTAWAEPSRLPGGGGDSQILVRVRKKGGGLLPGVEVRFRASEGTLYSGGKVLVTDGRGMTRDRVRTTKTTIITLNAGGTPFTLEINVGN